MTNSPSSRSPIPRSSPITAEVVGRFIAAFQRKDPSAIPDLVAADCVMEVMQPAPNGQRVEGYEANVAFWQAMVADSTGTFEIEDVVICGDRATNRWRYRFGEDEQSSVRGVTPVPGPRRQDPRSLRLREDLSAQRAGSGSWLTAAPSERVANRDGHHRQGSLPRLPAHGTSWPPLRAAPIDRVQQPGSPRRETKSETRTASQLPSELGLEPVRRLRHEFHIASIRMQAHRRQVRRASILRARVSGLQRERMLKLRRPPDGPSKPRPRRARANRWFPRRLPARAPPRRSIPPTAPIVPTLVPALQPRFQVDRPLESLCLGSYTCIVPDTRSRKRARRKARKQRERQSRPSKHHSTRRTNHAVRHGRPRTWARLASMNTNLARTAGMPRRPTPRDALLRRIARLAAL